MKKTITLNGEEFEASCATCEKSSETYEAGRFLCARRGIVNAEHFCRFYVYDLLKRAPRRKPRIETLEAE
jgi:hypothetical protein